MNKLLQLLREASAFSEDNIGFLEDLYEKFLRDPESVDESWREQFRSIQYELAKAEPYAEKVIGKSEAEDLLRKQSAVDRLICQYRTRGHQAADNNPLKLSPPPGLRDLDPAYYGLGEEELDRLFYIDILRSSERLPLREILSMLRETYCGPVGAEYMHIVDSDIKQWIQKRLESTRARGNFDADEKRWILRLLTAAEGIEKYLHRKYVGQKRFSLEGAETLIPLLDELIQRAGEKGSKEIVMGMAHRGRLNVLINILGKNPARCFRNSRGSIRTRPRMPVQAT